MYNCRCLLLQVNDSYYCSKVGPSEKPTNYFMPMASHGSIHSLATTNKTELVWHLAHKPELKLSYITICVHRNIMWRGKGREEKIT